MLAQQHVIGIGQRGHAVRFREDKPEDLARVRSVSVSVSVLVVVHRAREVTGRTAGAISGSRGGLRPPGQDPRSAWCSVTAGPFPGPS
jgi:hypothetical protein